MFESFTSTSRALPGSLRVRKETVFRGVKQEVRIDLACEGFDTGLHEQPFLFFQGALDPRAVPNPQGQTDPDGGGQDNQKRRPETPLRVEVEQLARRKKASRPHPGDFKDHPHQEKQDLPVHARIGEAPPNRAVKAQLDKGRILPDLLFVGTDIADQAPDQRVEGKHYDRHPLPADQESRQVHHQAHEQTHHSPGPAIRPAG